ncbi:Hypothetical protein SMAX5B_019549 [Scophthalmus maximus]|uniref:Uncharacterized protein n=1 Tax=Scophthalmus maximus TaxID=52904 RepID=A0A2U9C5H7_SCOMX|nr:Hypothetical protein SMAX5B_019549 [Scophthalmus maximus]
MSVNHSPALVVFNIYTTSSERIRSSQILSNPVDHTDLTSPVGLQAAAFDALSFFVQISSSGHLGFFENQKWIQIVLPDVFSSLLFLDLPGKRHEVKDKRQGGFIGLRKRESDSTDTEPRGRVTVDVVDASVAVKRLKMNYEKPQGLHQHVSVFYDSYVTVTYIWVIFIPFFFYFYFFYGLNRLRSCMKRHFKYRCRNELWDVCFSFLSHRKLQCSLR